MHLDSGKIATDLHVRLLALDPLTLFRCLRLSRVPLYGTGHDVRTLDGLVTHLGNTVVRRAFDVPVCETVQSHKGLRKLWLHTIAVAVAAQNLAEMTRTLHPWEAYLLGIVRSLPRWFTELEAIADDSSAEANHSRPRVTTALEWARHWNFEPLLRETLDESNGNGKIGKIPELLNAAELLAELADYWPPGDARQEVRRLLLASATREQLVQAQTIRLEVRDALEGCGLGEDLPMNETILLGSRNPALAMLPAAPAGDLAVMVPMLLSCKDAGSYRGIVTATMSLPQRYMKFDRTFYVQWKSGTANCWVRSKADFTPQRVRDGRMTLSPKEQEVLAEAVRSGNTELLCRDRSQTTGMLAQLGTDEALVVAMNVEFDVCSFLVVDRFAGLGSLTHMEDRRSLRTIAATATLVTENLLLENQRRRAMKFSLTDPLTRLSNRGSGIRALEYETARNGRTNEPLSVLMLDLDDFKNLNDTFGHMRGDIALRSTADVLRKTLRKSDTICRYGGEEFLVVLPDTDAEKASILAARVFVAIEEAGTAEGLPLTISIGLAQRQEDEAAETLLHRADKALYASKATGRNRFSVDIG